MPIRERIMHLNLNNDQSLPTWHPIVTTQFKMYPYSMVYFSRSISYFLALHVMVTAVNTLDDIFVVSTYQSPDNSYAEDQFLLPQIDMNLTLCWWYMPRDTYRGDALFSITTSGNSHELSGLALKIVFPEFIPLGVFLTQISQYISL